MRITALKAQQRNAERVSVYADGKYAFSLTQSQLLEFKLFVGKELSESDAAELKQASDYGKLLERVMNYVMIRPRSVREVRDYLWRKKANPHTADGIVEYLKSRGYLSDAAFAASWARTRQLTKPVSKRRLTAELQQKGVASDIIQQVVSQDNYNEAQALHEIITKKRRLGRYQDDNKLTQYLARQGFSYDAIKSAIQNATSEEPT